MTDTPLLVGFGLKLILTWGCRSYNLDIAAIGVRANAFREVAAVERGNYDTSIYQLALWPPPRYYYYNSKQNGFRVLGFGLFQVYQGKWFVQVTKSTTT